MTKPTVRVAGIGAVSAAGHDVASHLNSFQSGQRNPTSHLPFDCSISAPTFQVDATLPTLLPQYNNSRTLRLTMHALAEAIANADIKDFPRTTKVGVCIGTTVASQLNSLSFHEAYRRTGQPPLQPVYDYLHANLAQAVGDLLNVSGPRMTVCNACSSGADAIGIAANWIRAGLCDIAVAGGADEINRVPIAGFSSLGVMSSQPCAPFDRDRSGLNLGEGAGILILESATHAESRGKNPAFEIAGFGAACDAHHLTAPHPQGRGLNAAIAAALSQANITAAQVAFINAHGTATLDNDRVEANLIAGLFGTETPFLSTKGYTGHTLGAAGGLEAIFTILGLREKWIPASVGFENQPDDIPVSPVRQLTKIDGKFALSTSLAFGGNNAAMLIRSLI
jgi:3-oxoacyl-[acyl-carrier-protein] synthase II